MNRISKKLLSIIVMVSVMAGIICASHGTSPYVSMASAEMTAGIYELDFITQLTVACEDKGGFYMVDNGGIWFYSNDTHSITNHFTFSDQNDIYCYPDISYAVRYFYYANNNIYVMMKRAIQGEDNAGYREERFMLVYSLSEQKVTDKVPIDIENAFTFGVDSYGRIYIATKDNYIHLLDASGQKLSCVSVDKSVTRIGGFDASNGNFYYAKYNDYMMYVGNVKDNVITLSDICLDGTGMGYGGCIPSLLAGRYLVLQERNSLGKRTDADRGRWLYIYDSNNINTSGGTVGEGSYIRLRIPRRDYESQVRYSAAIDERIVMGNTSDSLLVYTNNNTLTEYSLKDSSVICRGRTSHPVSKIIKYGDGYIAFEEENGKCYVEYIPWQWTKTLSIEGDNEIQVGNSCVLKDVTDGTLDYSNAGVWSSSNAKIASVYGDGMVIGMKEGNVTIKHSIYGMSAEFPLTVKKRVKNSGHPKELVINSGVKSSNAGDNDYDTYGKVIKSYLYEDTDGKLVRVECIGNKIIVEKYNKDSVVYSKSIENPLSLFGGFYAGKTHNYIVVGESNPNEDVNQEVVRVISYSKNWEYERQMSIKGINTFVPFAFGTLRMYEDGGRLYIHTCHTMFKSPDGLNHQANMSFVFNTDSLECIDSEYEVVGGTAYVSHSMNQFVRVDGNMLYYADQGDAYPRALRFSRREVDKSPKDYILYDAMSFKGSIEDSNYNYTGASLGGFEISHEKCITVGNEDAVYGELKCRNIFLCMTDKNLFSKTPGEKLNITNYKESDGITAYTPQLVKVDMASFLLLWETENTKDNKLTTSMVRIDCDGNVVSDIVNTNARLSDCQPIVTSDGYVRWYTTGESRRFDGWRIEHTGDGVPRIYTVDPYDLEKYAITEKDTAETNKAKSKITKKKAGVTYVVNSGKQAVLKSVDKKLKGKFTVPESIKIKGKTYKVTSIGKKAFSGQKQLKQVVISKNIKKIGKQAFYGCSRLRKVTIKSVKLKKKNIGKQAFGRIHKKARFKVPRSKVKAYGKIFGKKRV